METIRFEGVGNRWKTYFLHLKAASKYTIFLVQMCIALNIKRGVARVRNAFYKATSQRAIRLHSGKSIFIIFAPFDVNPFMLILRAKIAVSVVICMTLYVFVRVRV